MNAETASVKRTPAPTAVRRIPPRTLGAILVDSGKLKLEDANRALHLQKEKGVPFGQALLELELVTQADLDGALANQYNFPYLQQGSSPVAEEVVSAYKPQCTEAEALRVVRSQLMLRWFQGESQHKVLAVTSGQAGEGRSYVAANLAVVFAQMGERVLLIDADLRKPRQHDLFGLDNRRGLSAILSNRSALDAVQKVTGLGDLTVLVAGAAPPNPQELLASDSFSKLLQYVGQIYDVVIVDTPPAMQSADAQVIASRAKGAVIVVRKDHTAVEDLKRLADQIQEGGSTPVGVVLNEFE